MWQATLCDLRLSMFREPLWEGAFVVAVGTTGNTQSMRRPRPHKGRWPGATWAVVQTTFFCVCNFEMKLTMAALFNGPVPWIL